MQLYCTSSLFLFAVLLRAAVAEELDQKDVPAACATICKPIVELTTICDVDDDKDKTESDEAIEARCICSNKSFNVAAIAPLCASCMKQNGSTSKDMSEILAACSFSSTSYAPTATALVASVTVSATKPTLMVSTTNQGTAKTSTPTGSAAGMGVSGGNWGYMIATLLLVGLGAGMV